MNTPWVQRLLNGINRPTPALVPLNMGQSDYGDEGGSSRGRGRGEGRGGGRKYRSPSPEERRPSRRQEKAPKKEKRRARSPSSSSSETEAYGSSGSSDYSSYDEVETIKKKYAKEPCEYISPAALSQKKSKKEVVNYLEEKGCPKIETHAKKRKHIPPATVSSTPAPSTAPPPPPSVSSSGPPPASSVAPPPAVKDEGVKKKPVGRPKKPVDPTAKPKKAPSAYNLAVAKHRKTGLSFTDAVKAAKAELDSKKSGQQ